MAIDVEAIYRRYGPMALRRCRQLLSSQAAAEDAMHDVFVNLIANRSRLDERALSSLVFRVATNVCLNRIRARARRPEDADESLPERIAIASAEERSLARDTLGRLFGREQISTGDIAVMHLVDGMTLGQVAREVGLSVSGVRKRLRALRARVRELAEV